MYKVVLFGLGGGYDRFVSFGGLEKVDVIAITDKNCKFFKYIDGIPVVDLDDILCGGGF